MKPTANNNSQRGVHDALCAAVQIAQDLQTHYSLTSILAGNTDDPSDDFLGAVDLIAGLYFSSHDEASATIARNAPQSAGDKLLGMHFGRSDAVAKAALVLGLAWALVERRSLARTQPVH